MIQHDLPATILNCTIVSPDLVIFEGEITQVFVPGINQELAILPDHTPLYAQLQPGTVKLINKENRPQEFNIDSGVVRVRNNHVTIVTGFDAHSQVMETKS
jgi:F-type H+-transporting ATPase subunit epsilon